MLLFRDIADRHLEGLADSGLHSYELAAVVQVHLVDGFEEHFHDIARPVQAPHSEGAVGDETQMQEVVDYNGASKTHSILKSSFL